MARPVREWLADQAAVVPTDTGQKRGSPAALSRIDSAAAWPARTARGRFGYALNLLIDTPSGVALDVQADPGERFTGTVRTAEVGHLQVASVESERQRCRRTRELAHRDDQAYLQVGLLTDCAPTSHFMVLRARDRAHLCANPFLPDSPPLNAIGVGTVTAADEAVGARAMALRAPMIVFLNVIVNT